MLVLVLVELPCGDPVAEPLASLWLARAGALRRSPVPTA